MDKDFLWITAVESAFLPQARHVNERPLDEYELAQHYQYWEQDIDLAKSVGAHAMRYSIPWYKVNPQPGKYDWSWIDRVLDRLVKKNGMKLMADINHYNSPLWLDNEYLNASFPDRFAEYAMEFARRYKQLVHSYVPYNEPVVNASFSGENGEWAPYLHGNDGFLKILTSLAKAVVRARQEIRSVDSGAVFVEVEGVVSCEALERELVETARIKTDRRTALYDLITGRVDERHPLFSYLTSNGMSDHDLNWFHDNKVEIGIVGLNYYPQISHIELDRNGENWVEIPIADSLKHLENIFREYYKKYNAPMILSETGYFGGDEGKIQWLETSAELIRRLRKEGLPIVGYDWWFLLDSIGWDYKWGEGPAADYLGFFHHRGQKQPRKDDGLFALQPEPNGNLKRVRNRVADVFKRLAEQDMS